MGEKEAMQRKYNKPSWNAILPGVLVVLLGMVIMIESNIPLAIWAQNGLGLLLGICGIRLQVFCFRKGAKKLFVWMLLGLILLAAPFFFPGVKEVHRWISLGSVQIHIASLVLPALLILLAQFQKKTNGRGFIIVAFLAIAILGLQPDAAQLTGFAGAVCLLLFSKRDPRIWWTLGYSAIAVAIVWLWRDSLPEVLHVEGIVSMAYALGESWGIASIGLLVLLPLPFLFAGIARRNSMYLALGLYFMLTLYSAGLGNFPFILLGYGATPIVGYFWAISVLVNHYPDLIDSGGRK